MIETSSSAHGIQVQGARPSALASVWLSIPAMVGFVALTAVAAQVRIPLPWTGVPMTLHLVAVLLTGMVLSPKCAALAMSAYAVCGAAGLPVFAQGSLGIAGPTGGYIVGFVAAAWLVAVMRGAGCSSVARLVLAGLCGTAVLFVFGAIGLLVWALVSGRHPSVEVFAGTVPFIPKALVELGVAVSLVAAVRGLSRNKLRA